MSSTVLIHFYPKLKLDDNIGEKKVPQLRGVSISDNAPAFQRSVNNLATLAYATEGNLLRGIVNCLGVLYCLAHVIFVTLFFCILVTLVA